MRTIRWSWLVTPTKVSLACWSNRVIDILCRTTIHIRIGVCPESMAETRDNSSSIRFDSSYFAIRFSICVCHNQMFHHARERKGGVGSLPVR